MPTRRTRTVEDGRRTGEQVLDPGRDFPCAVGGGYVQNLVVLADPGTSLCVKNTSKPAPTNGSVVGGK